MAAALSAVAGAVFVGVAISQWRAFQVNAYDLAIFDQVVWNTSRGQWYETSFAEYGNYLGQHFSPVVAVFVPAYMLGGGPLLLTGVQGLVAAIAALPLYAAGRRWGLAPMVAVALAGAYLLNPYLHHAVAFDFHPETMVVLPAFGSVWAVADGRYRLAALLGATTLLFKEDSVFVALALAALIAWQGGRREGALLAIVSVATSLLAIGVLMPHFREGAPNDFLPRYGYLAPAAASEWELATTALRNPGPLVEALSRDGRVWTAVVFVVVSAPLALLRPVWLLALVPGLAVALFSSLEWQNTLAFHYAVQLVPLALIGVALGARQVAGRIPADAVVAAMLLPALLGFLAQSPFSPIAADEPTPSERHREALAEAVALIPAGDTVSAQSSIVPRLSQRPTVAEFPGRRWEAEWVVVDQYGARSSTSLAAGFWDALVETRARYERVYEGDGVEVYRNPEPEEPTY